MKKMNGFKIPGKERKLNFIFKPEATPEKIS